MFKRILVPLDGSERAARAIPVAARLARAAGGTVILGRAVQAQSVLTSSAADSQPDTLKAYETQAMAYLADVTKSTELAGIPVQTMVRVGPAAWEMLATAQVQAADLIVICSHGHTGFKRWVLGSVAQHIARQAQVPVLVLREQGADPASTHLAVDAEVEIRMLVALDGSGLSEAALLPAITLAQELSADGRGAVHLLFVANPYDVTESELTHQNALDAAQTYLASISQQMCDQLGNDRAPVLTWSVATDFDIASAIIRVATYDENSGEVTGAERNVTGSFDMIAMATHGRTGVALWALGSVTERVLQSTQLPMLIVRSPVKASGEPTPMPMQAPALNATVNMWPGLL
jgi:nucleotide-binding universal stress UspA family protein